MPTSTLPVRPESLVKNVALAVYFSVGPAYLTTSSLFIGQDVPGRSVALVAVAGLLMIIAGAVLVLPRRVPAVPVQKPLTPLEFKHGVILPESIAKNLVIAAYFTGGSWLLTASRTFEQFGFATNKAMLRIIIVGLVWVFLGAWLLIPNRRKVVEGDHAPADVPSTPASR